jgi:hypothetical protein
MTETPLVCCAGVTRTACLLAIVLAFIAPGLAQDHSDRPLMNSDVMKMVNAGIPEASRRIASCTCAA